MKKLSLILAILMIASLFTVALPVSVAAEDDDGPECLVNGIEYASLEDALIFGVLDEATENTTVTLLKDIEVKAAITFTSKHTNADGSPIVFTFDLNGHTVTASAGNVFQLGRNKDDAANSIENILIFKNGYIDYYGPGSVFQLYSYGKCDLENLVITCNKPVNYCVLNSMTASGSNGLDIVVNVKNVDITMPAQAGTNQCSFVRTGNPATERVDDPPATWNIENCNFNTVGEFPATNPARGIYVTSAMANVTVKNTTISSPAAPVYFSTTAVDYNTTDGVTTPQLTLVDCEYTLLNPDKNAEVVHNPQGLAIDDNPEIANGFQGFEKPEIVVTLPEAPETSAVPETTPVPETSAVPETTPAPETTEAPTTNAPTTNAPTEAPITTTAKPDTTTAPTNNENKGGGCGGFTVAASFLAIICAAGAAIVIKKK